MPPPDTLLKGVLIEDIGIALRGLFIINPEGRLEQITINNLPVSQSIICVHHLPS